MNEIASQTARETGVGTARGRGAAALQYQSGFGNNFSSEAVSGALPVGRN